MEKHGEFTYFTFEEVKDKWFGEKGTPEREEYEQEVKEMFEEMEKEKAEKEKTKLKFQFPKYAAAMF